MNDRIESVLSRLPEPVPPGTLVAVVMARVSRQHEERASPSKAAAVRGVSDLFAWVAVLAGVAIVGVSWINGAHDDGTWLNLMSSMAPPSMAPTPVTTPAGVWLTLGLLLYLVGLLAPPRHRETSRPTAGRALR